MAEPKSKRRRVSQIALPVRPIRWTLNVEGFSKIRSATIHMAPLVLLVGKNNTGKSHLASLIWGLLNSERLIFGRTAKQKPAPDQFRSILQAGSREKREVEITLEDDFIDQVERDINQTLKERKDDLVRQLLTFEGASAKRVELRLCRETFPRRIRSGFVQSKDSAFFSWANQPTDEYDLRIGSAEDGPHDFFPQFLYNLFMSGVITGGNTPSPAGAATYIPAARTGLMLAFSSLVSRLFDNLSLSGSEEAPPKFPLPIVRFLQSLNEPARAGNAKFSKIAQVLEKEVLHGEIRAGSGVNKQFTYVTHLSEHPLPLHVSSSMVTELAPFLLLLRSGALRAGVIFEEPEAHLHLSAQRSMARTIAQLVNAGIPVVVTTHSDTFLQQINISMQLFRHPRRAALCKAFGYTKDDVLDPNMARAYEFVDGEAGTTVNELLQSVGGFVVPSLNSPLENLSSEVLAMGSWE